MQLIHDPCAHLHQPMPVPQQLSQIPIRRTRYPKFAESYFLGFDLRRIETAAPDCCLDILAGQNAVPKNTEVMAKRGSSPAAEPTEQYLLSRVVAVRKLSQITREALHCRLF